MRLCKLARACHDGTQATLNRVNTGKTELKFLEELKRRNVFRAAAAYLAVAWLLVQIAQTVFPAFELGNAALRSVIFVAALGFFPTIFIAWYFEFNRGGFKREQDVDHSNQVSIRWNLLVDRLIVALLAVALTYFVVDKIFFESERIDAAIEQGRLNSLEESYGEHSIVVMPFVNMSADPQQDYFADGMAEELLNLLAQIPQLRVISRTSAFSFKGKSISAPQVARKLNVTWLLEGSVRRSVDTLRVTVQLIDARTDTHEWSATWDRPLKDIFAVQDEIAAKVVSRLKLKLLPQSAHRHETNSRAYILFMQARQMLADRDTDYDKAYGLLEEALKIDPQYADAWAALSWVYYRYRLLPDVSDIAVFRDLSATEADRLSREANQRALDIDDENATANAFQGWRLAFIDRDIAAAAPWFERALKRDPANSDVLRTSTMYASLLRRPRDAVRLGEYTMVRDPLCVPCTYDLVYIYMDADEYGNAEALMKPRVSDEAGGWYTYGITLLHQDKNREALSAFKHIKANQRKYRLKGQAMALYSLGVMDAADATLARFESDFASGNPLDAAAIYAWRGDVDAALHWIKAGIALQGGEAAARTIVADPDLRTLERQPVVSALIRKYGLSIGQLSKIDIDFSLPDVSG